MKAQGQTGKAANSQAGKTSRSQSRDKVDVFADLMESGAFGADNTAEQESFVEVFSSTVSGPAATLTLAAQMAKEYGFKPSKEQSFDIPIERILDSPYQQRLERSQWTERQRREYERLRTSVREGLNEVFFVAPYPNRPGYFFIAYGGHNRRDAARDEGHTTIPCVIVAYDETNEEHEERIGFGTTFENEVKIPMTLEERGRLYRKLMLRFKLSQDKLGKRLDLTRDIVKDCLMVAESAADIRELARDLPEGSGVRIARALGRLEQLSEILKNEEETNEERALHIKEAPRVARVPLIKAYKTGEMKTELIESYIEEILRLAQEDGSLSVEEILSQVFRSGQPEVQPALEEHVEQRVEEQPQSLVVASSAPARASTETFSLGDQPVRSKIEATPVPEREERRGREVPAAPAAPVSSGVAESALRMDKLLKAQKYLKAYRNLAAGTKKGEQEMRILADMGADIQEETAQPIANA